jgi:Uma2 family endonuclease
MMVLMLRKLLLYKRKYARARAILSGFVVDQKQRDFFCFLRVLSRSFFLSASE